MSILTHDAIVAELKAGQIVIEPPLPAEQIKEASVDLRLGNTFRVFKNLKQVIPVQQNTDYQDFTEELVTDRLLLTPGETVLGVTLEKITLPTSICGWLEGRSRFARLGLLIHISAGLIQPGVSNHQVLEITNLSPNVLELVVGERICQLAFQRCEGSVQYQGKYSQQIVP